MIDDTRENGRRVGETWNKKPDVLTVPRRCSCYSMFAVVTRRRVCRDVFGDSIVGDARGRVVVG